MKPVYKFGMAQVEKKLPLEEEIATIPAPAADPAQLASLMGTGGYLPELGASSATPPPAEYAPPPPTSMAQNYADYSDAGLIAGLGAEFGSKTDTAKELVKERILRQQALDQQAREDSYRQELMSPNSATGLRQQEYLKRMGVDASGLGANDIHALNASQGANALQLAGANNAADLEQKRLEMENRVKIALIKKKGGGGGGLGSMSGPNGEPMSKDQYDAWLLDVAAGNPTTAEYYRHNRKALDKAIPAYNVRTEADRQKRLADAEDQRKNIAKSVQDYAKQREFYDRNVGPLRDAMKILDKYTNKDVPGVGPLDSRVGIPIARAKEWMGMGNEDDRAALELDRASNMARQLYQQLRTGMGVSIPEGLENKIIMATDKNASEPERRKALTEVFEMLEGVRQNLDAGFGPQVVTAYEGNKARTKGQIIVRNKQTGAQKAYPIASEAKLRAAPDFDKKYEITGSGF